MSGLLPGIPQIVILVVGSAFTCDEDGNIEEITLKQNNLSGFVPDVHFPHLKVFGVAENPIGDTLPNFSGIPLVEELFLNNSFFVGAIPEFEQCPNLNLLFLHNNELGPTLPKWTNLSNLKTLFLANNNLSGCYPVEWVGTICDQLQSFTFTGNPDLLPGNKTEDFAFFCAVGPAACFPDSCGDGNDTEAPVFEFCPSDTTIIVESIVDSIAVQWMVPEVRDTCSLVALTTTHQPGDIFPVGLTNVSYVAADQTGNESSCSFAVEVQHDNTTAAVESYLNGGPELRQVFPNPFSTSVSFTFYLPTAQGVQVSIFDLMGNSILQKQKWFGPGKHTWEINFDQIIPSGVYLFSIKTNGKIFQGKMVRQ